MKHTHLAFGAAVKAMPANVVWTAPEAVPVASVIAEPPTDDTITRGTALDSAMSSSEGS